MAFHPYPQLIPPVFNLGGFGPPHALTRASTWPWVDHPASGLERATARPFRLAFATDPPHGLTSRHATNSQAHSSIGTPSPLKALTACKRPVSGTISLPSRGTFHHSLTVLSTIGHQEVFRQPSGLGRFTQDSTSPVLLGQTVPDTHQPVPPTGVSPTTPRLPRRFSYRPAHAPPLRQKRTGQPHNPAHATPAEYHTHTV